MSPVDTPEACDLFKYPVIEHGAYEGYKNKREKKLILNENFTGENYLLTHVLLRRLDNSWHML